MTEVRSLNDLKARDVMTVDVITAHPEWTIEQLADFFMENAITGAPVVSEDGQLLGVVSMSDITWHSSLPGTSLPRPQPHKHYHLALENEYSEEDLETLRTQEWGEALVEDLMTPMVFDVSEKASIRTVADTMINGRIHRVLVTRDSELVGIITALDLLKVIRNL